MEKPTIKNGMMKKYGIYADAFISFALLSFLVFLNNSLVSSENLPDYKLGLASAAFVFILCYYCLYRNVRSKKEAVVLWFIKTTKRNYAISLSISVLMALAYFALAEYLHAFVPSLDRSMIAMLVISFALTYRIIEYHLTKKLVSPPLLLENGQTANMFFKVYVVALAGIFLLTGALVIISPEAHPEAPMLKECDLIESQQSKDTCYEYAGAKVLKTQVCDEIANVTIRDYCYVGIGEKTKSEYVCNNVTTSKYRDFCVMLVSAQNKDLSACTQIKNNVALYTCYAIIEKNISICEGIENQSYQGWCTNFTVYYLNK